MKKRHLLLALLLSLVGSAATPTQPKVSPEDKKYQALLGKAIQDVYYIEDPKNGGHGSGFHVQLKNKKVVIITNDHVCDSAKNKVALVGNFKMKGELKQSKIILGDPKLDLCALEPIGESSFYKIADSVTKWQRVRVYGYPADFNLSIFEGNILGYKRFRGHLPTVMINVGVIGGNSGGPVVNVNDEILGVIQLHDTEYLWLGGFIPAGVLVDFMTQVEAVYK